MYLKISGREPFLAVNPKKAKLRDLAALQSVTGLKLAELSAQFETNEAFGMQATVFLSEHNRGRFITWDEAGDLPMGDLDFILNEEEKARLAEGQVDTGQGVEGTAAAPGVADPLEPVSPPAPPAAPDAPPAPGTADPGTPLTS